MTVGIKDVKIKVLDNREATSVSKLLSRVIDLSDEQLAELFKLMPHEINDVKDVVRRSNLEIY